MATTDGSTTTVVMTEDTRYSEEISQAVTLFSQQIWCWGRDIERSEGNWLMEC